MVDDSDGAPSRAIAYSVAEQRFVVFLRMVHGRYNELVHGC